MSDIRKKIEEIAIDDKGSWIKKARYRRENRAWLRKSQRIAVRVLSVLDEKGMQQKELAEALDVSPQQVSKIVQGKQNLTLETISKLEAVLAVKLFDVPVPQYEMNVQRKNVRTNLSKEKSTAVKSKKDLSEMLMQLWEPSSEGEIAA
ncbi:MAG: helix-turn-helix transcriptional regulator [Balneolaceae bacterium]|nr:helix-turn-helix transcriptional regulator [Balneolaceae bacterium]MDR9410342.1 helix-turn-helix transcriptional regulator [Balneolaceae bacterium]